MDLVVGVKHTLLTIELMSKLASKLPSLAVANAIKHFCPVFTGL